MIDFSRLLISTAGKWGVGAQLGALLSVVAQAGEHSPLFDPYAVLDAEADESMIGEVRTAASLLGFRGASLAHSRFLFNGLCRDTPTPLRPEDLDLFQLQSRGQIEEQYGLIYGSALASMMAYPEDYTILRALIHGARRITRTPLVAEVGMSVIQDEVMRGYTIRDITPEDRHAFQKLTRATLDCTLYLVEPTYT